MKRVITISPRLMIFVLVAVLLGVLSSVSVLAQGGDLVARTAPTNPEDRVLNAPYSAQRRVTFVKKLADGTINRNEATESVARDSQGRTYNAGERQWTYLEGQKRILKSEMLYRIHDPVTETDTKWDSSTKEVKVIHWPKNAPDEDSSEAQCQPCFNPTMSPGTAVEKLGAKTLAGVFAQGTRESYAVPSGQSPNAQSIVVVHESWYCPELKIVILETDDDPRTGSYRNELVDIIRGEPDVSRYLPPRDYVVHEVQVPR
jgi:hypothetical protein